MQDERGDGDLGRRQTRAIAVAIERSPFIVVVAFDRGDDGELFPAFGHADQQSEDRALRTAKGLAGKHVG